MFYDVVSEHSACSAFDGAEDVKTKLRLQARKNAHRARADKLEAFQDFSSEDPIAASGILFRNEDILEER